MPQYRNRIVTVCAHVHPDSRLCIDADLPDKLTVRCQEMTRLVDGGQHFVNGPLRVDWAWCVVISTFGEAWQGLMRYSLV